MAHHSYDQFTGGGRHNDGGIDPNDLSMSGNFASPSFSAHNFGSPIPKNPSQGFSSGSALLPDDELFDGLGSSTDTQSGLHGHGQDYGGLRNLNMAFSHEDYGSHRGAGLHLNQSSHIHGYSNTPDGDPVQSPFAQNFGGPFRQVHHNQSLGTSLHSPISYSESPHASEFNAEIHDGSFANTKGRRVSQGMPQKQSVTRPPVTPTTNALHSMSMGSQDSSAFGPQPIRNVNSHDDSPDQWTHSATSYGPFSQLSQSLAQINGVKGMSMPARLGVPPAAAPSNSTPTTATNLSTSEMKRKRRRESHNLVERRRRDNINERIQDLSKLVPAHRLEDEKVRKMIQNGTPMSPSLGGGGGATTATRMSQATSVLAGPGLRRAAGSVGSITTGLPLEDKDKGPNKGDILNGAVSWTRDLMWMLHLKLQQHDEIANYIAELGGQFPFQLTDDERRMQTELANAMQKNSADQFSYTRTAGSGLRVPEHTDYRGDSLNGAGSSAEARTLSPSSGGGGHDLAEDFLDSGHFEAGNYWQDADEDGSGNMSVNFKEEDEYDMDLTH